MSGMDERTISFCPSAIMHDTPKKTTVLFVR